MWDGLKKFSKETRRSSENNLPKELIFSKVWVIFKLPSKNAPVIITTEVLAVFGPDR
jgi:hypothetical protein